MAETAGKHFNKLESGTEISLDQTDSLTTTSITSTASTTNKHVTTTNNNTISKVIFNDGTSAGILKGLKKCTRAMHLHEADVTLKTLGVILPSPSDITPNRIDQFRTILMTMYEKPGQFLRILKNENIDVSGSKLNIFGASTGDLIASELVRQAASLSADQLFERFIFWPVDGEPIRNDQCITSIDFYEYCSLEQFSIFCGFFADLILDIELDGKTILADQAFEFRVAGKESADETNLGLLAFDLFNKKPELRIAGFCGLLEAAFDMVPIYIDQFVSFDNGEVNDWFFERCSKIAENMYGPVLRKDERFVISTEICKRSQKVNVQNLAQYLSLMKISDEDKKKWMYSCGKNIRSCIEFSTIDGNKLPETTDISSKPELALSRKQENMLKKTNHYMASILLHPSLVFLKSGLYINSSLKKASSLLESSFLNPLVDEGYIVAIRNGLICKKSKVTVYIKTLPSDNNASKEDFAARLAFLNDVRLNFDTYIASCNTISLHTMGILNEEVMHVLQLERYEQLNIDFNSFFRRIDNGNDGPTYEINCTVLAKENELIENLMISQIEDNSSSVNDESSNNSEHQKINSIRSLDILSENDGADDSRVVVIDW
ncbi:unnamed protein product [Adineta steineri]|uniref:Uncharacterized protein n=1 Tax=Adineta steineri TaxID=433720 RepID=A0A819P370_9BILA|nr:unnamed protein product [Adineta steineri]